MALTYAVLAFFGLTIVRSLLQRWLDRVLWPWIADWWASRSQVRLRKRIKKLEAMAARNESLPLLTEYERVMLIAVGTFFRLMWVIPAMLFSLYSSIKDLEGHPIRGWPFLDWAVGILLIIVLGKHWENYFDHFRLPRSRSFRETLNTEIANLKKNLK
jgi:hypothetical protein